jgi:hypothetical protein
MVYFRSKFITKLHGFRKLAKILIYDVMYLRNINDVKYETLYALPPEGRLLRVLILKL